LPKLVYEYFSPSGLKKGNNLTNSSRVIIKEAEKHGITWKIIPGTEIVSLTYKGQEKSYHHQVPSSCTALAHYICRNKKITNNLLQQAEINAPKSYHINQDDDKKYLRAIFEKLKKPLVVKPLSGTWGENITLGLNSFDKYLEAIKLAFAYSSGKKTGAVIEEMFTGEEYRILATREKVIGVVKRIPANVIGDGKNNIKQLIKIKNQEDIRGEKGSNRSHLKIRIDKKLKEYLEEQKLDLENIPKKGKRVFLRKVSNISQGGDAIDFTDQIHPSVKEIAIKAIRTIPGLSFAGIDFMSTDVSKKQNKESYVIIEINDSPGFDIHDYPYEGKNRHAAREFLYLLFPELERVK